MVKFEFKQKKSKRTRRLIKDKAIVNFLLVHMKRTKIDFSKFKIPSYMNLLISEGKISDNPNSFQEQETTDKKLEVSSLKSLLEKRRK